MTPISNLKDQSYDYLEQTGNLITDHMVQAARKSLRAFTMLTKPDYRMHWHHKVTCDKLNDFVEGKIKYLMIFEPPRHGKSELTSRRLPAYLHGRYPDKQIMLASYSDHLAAKMTVAVQEIIDSATYKLIFPETKIWPQGTPYAKGIRNQNEHNIIGRKGSYMGQGVGGSYTGLGSSFILIDDPIKGRKMADSRAFRETLWSFWLNDLYSRLETDLETGREGQVLVTLTRWHEDDLAGRLIEEMKNTPGAIQWEIVDFPAIRVDMDNPDDPRELGEALWPEKYNEEKLAQIKVTIGSRAWSSLYQQKPVVQGGNIIKGVELVRYNILPQLKYRKIFADTAQKTKEHNDFSVFECWGHGVDGKIYLLDMIRGKWEAPELQKRAIAFWKKHSALSPDDFGSLREMKVEDKSSGTGLIQTLKVGDIQKDTPQIPIKGIERNRDKLSRVNDALPYIEAGMVCIPESAAFTNDFVEECEAFTANDTHLHDDQIDPMIDAISDMLSNENKLKMWERLAQ